MDFISTRTTQFSYFDQLLGNPLWKDRKILDFGGNRGGFLVNSGDRIDHENYWCTDVVQAALDEGRRQFPRAHFLHYDRYSAEFNPSGVRYQPVPDFGFDFDIILAFSVFTHTHQKEMRELAEQLRRLLAPKGILAFTFIDPTYKMGSSGLYLRILLKMLQSQFPSLDTEGIVERACQSTWSILIDDKLHVEPGDDLCQQELPGGRLESYCAFYTVVYMASLFPDGMILPPVRHEWQHCCILGKP
jgi:SAM-dependent methyltransferase